MTKSSSALLPSQELTTQITFRIPKGYLRRADKLAKKLSYPGHELSRTDVFRVAIETSFTRLENKTTDEK